MKWLTYDVLFKDYEIEKVRLNKRISLPMVMCMRIDVH